MNLNAVIQRQLDFFDRQMPLASGDKIFHALDKLCTEVGLKEASPYFNDPAQPTELLQAHNEQLSRMVMQLQQQLQQNPLAEAQMIETQGKLAVENRKLDQKDREMILKLAQSDKHFAAELAAKLTQMELDSNQDVPGSLV